MAAIFTPAKESYFMTTPCPLARVLGGAERRQDGIKYFDLDDPDTKDIRPVIKLLDEVLAGRK
jgi:hypothetical protein